MGTVDQHSQLQLCLEGNRDKFFNFIIAKQTLIKRRFLVQVGKQLLQQLKLLVCNVSFGLKLNWRESIHS